MTGEPTHPEALEGALLQAVQESPGDETPWLVLADWLEEQADPRAELVRLQLALRRQPGPAERLAWEERVRTLLASGVRPCVPLLTNSIGMQLALILAGRFLMGSPERSDDEGPQHEVEISKPFYLGIYQVTQAEYEKVMSTNPSWFSATGGGNDKIEGQDTSRFPVECVTWEDANEFCKKLSELPDEQESGRVYRLPTEAEWEYACRGGAASATPFSFGASLSSTQANFNGGYPYGGADKGPFLGRTATVGSYHPNIFGLYDMHGNVWEWCADWYDEDYSQSPAGKDPPGAATGTRRVLRGGSWYFHGRASIVV
jgi:uncharacterized protein (TIGR02996 family)